MHKHICDGVKIKNIPISKTLSGDIKPHNTLSRCYQNTSMQKIVQEYQQFYSFLIGKNNMTIENMLIEGITEYLSFFAII